MELIHIVTNLAYFVICFCAVKVFGQILSVFTPLWIGKIVQIIFQFIFTILTFKITNKLRFNERIKPEGKAILITGSARGIGHALAKHLDSKGFYVFASCRDANSTGADDLIQSCSSRLKVFELDVTKDESVEKAVEFVQDNLGPSELWAVINNAAIQKGFLTELTSIEDFKDTLETNVLGTVRVTKAFLPLLRKSKGRVVNMASLAGRFAVPYTGSYVTSKYAVIGFSECLRHEMDAWGIRVISIEPEMFETELSTEKNIMLRFDDAILSADEDVRKDYGEKFLRECKKALSRAIPPSSNIQKVLDAAETAVCLKTPGAVYKVHRNIAFAVLCTILEFCPPEFHIFIAKTYFRILGVSKPEKAI